MEASAKLNINVEEVFLTIPIQLLRAYELQQQIISAKEVRNVKIVLFSTKFLVEKSYSFPPYLKN